MAGWHDISKITKHGYSKLQLIIQLILRSFHSAKITACNIDTHYHKIHCRETQQVPLILINHDHARKRKNVCKCKALLRGRHDIQVNYTEAIRKNILILFCSRSLQLQQNAARYKRHPAANQQHGIVSCAPAPLRNFNRISSWKYNHGKPHSSCYTIGTRLKFFFIMLHILSSVLSWV